jgi:hypothetical protein
MSKRAADLEKLEEELARAMQRLERLERETQDLARLNALNDFLLEHGRKAYFLFGPFGHEAALSKLERDSNWPWREVNRRCNFCGCFLFPAKEMERMPPMNTLDIDFEQASREHMLKSSSQQMECDPVTHDLILKGPEEYQTYYYARGRKVPFGDYTVLYFHGPCFDRILSSDWGPAQDRARYLGSD